MIRPLDGASNCLLSVGGDSEVTGNVGNFADDFSLSPTVWKKFGQGDFLIPSPPTPSLGVSGEICVVGKSST